LYSLITQRTSSIHMRGPLATGTAKEGVDASKLGMLDGDVYIRDYREVPLPEMESAYEKEFMTA